MSLPTYDPADIIITFAGNTIAGFADGTFVTVKRRSDAFSLYVGADGEASRARSRDTSCEVEIELAATAISNDVLNASAAADAKDGTGVGAFQLKDKNGKSIVSASDAWVQKLPDQEFGKEVSTRKWVLAMGKTDVTVGSTTR